MSRRISFLNFKGGVGKTSLAVNIAAHLAYHKARRTLLVDMDPQSNASQWLLGFKLWKELNENPEHTVYAIYMNGNRNVGKNLIQAPVKKADGQVEIANLDILPASYRLMDLEHEFRDSPAAPYYHHFLHHISIFFPHYEYVIFDCPPNLYRGALCALFATNEVYVPCNPDQLSYAGLSYLAQKIAEFKKVAVKESKLVRVDRMASIRGIIINDANPRANYDAIMEQFRSKLSAIQRDNPEVVFPDVRIISPNIRSYEDARKAAYSEKPVTLRGGPLAADYGEIADYIDALDH